MPCDVVMYVVMVMRVMLMDIDDGVDGVQSEEVDD